MVKQTFRFLLSATLLVASGSFARADNFSITSNWHTGSAQFADLVTFTGNGTFTESGGVFSNIVFTFQETSPGSSTIWTALSGDGELLSGNTVLIIGDQGTDCGLDCVDIHLSGAVGSAPTLTGTSASSSEPNTTFDSATLTDTSSVPEPTSVLLLLTVVVGTGFALRKKLRGVSPITES